MKKMSIFISTPKKISISSRKISIILLSVMLIAILNGCSEKITISESDFILSEDVTKAGITVGSSWNDFYTCYQAYPTQLLDDNGNWSSFSYPKEKEETTLYKSTMSLMISYFFIDGVATDTADLMEATGKSADELNDYLASKEYLSSHKVIFRYIVFDFTDGVITSLDDNFLDYNTEL